MSTDVRLAVGLLVLIAVALLALTIAGVAHRTAVLTAPCERSCNSPS